jgi:hypothetical protein
MSVWERVRSLFGPQAGLALGVLAFLLVLFLGINNYMLWQRVNDLKRVFLEITYRSFV